MSIEIDVDKKILENNERIEIIKTKIPKLKRQLRVFERELRKLSYINFFLNEEKDKLKIK